VLRGAAILAASIAVLVLPARAGAGLAEQDGATALKGIAAAVAAGRLSSENGAHYRESVTRALSVVNRLPNPRAANLGAVLHEVAVQASSLNEPRALALFSMLEVNTSYFATHVVPGSPKDISGPDRVLYRYFYGRGFQFHPLGNFGALNADLAAGHDDDAAQLAAALVARGVRRDGGLVWEYYFPFGGGAAPWTSGMAQAVAAQALARAGEHFGDSSLTDAARATYATIPGRLLLDLPAGPWIKLYSFGRSVVLNAQLQAAISVADYATIAGDQGATATAGLLQSAAATLLPRFDTGYWSLYSLGGPESSLDYHQYVVSLLQKLAGRTTDTRFASAGQRFQVDLKQPPAFELGEPSAPLYPRPADGFRDVGIVSFWLSKRSFVTLQVAGERRALSLGFGWHRLQWTPPSAAPAAYQAALGAVDLAGNRASIDLLPLVVLADTRPPDATAQLAAGALTWSAVDDGTPWLRLRLVLRGSGGPRLFDLGRRPLSGKAAPKLPKGSWQATLSLANSAGRVVRVELGTVDVSG
jgi:hypothetical protein